MDDEEKKMIKVQPDHRKAKQNMDKFISKVKTGLSHRGLNRALLFLLFLSACLMAVDYANTNNFISIPAGFLRPLQIFLVIMLSYAVATLVLRISVDPVIKSFDRDAPLEKKILISKLYIAAVYVVATIFVFIYLGLEVQNITIFLGFMATGIAFAVRDVILSYLVWFMLLTKRPFKIGDYIRIGEDEGVVKHIGTFYVLIDSTPQTKEDFVRIPNKIFLEKSIINFGQETIFDSVLVPVKKAGPALDKKLDELSARLARMAEEKISMNILSTKEGISLNFRYEAKGPLRRDAVRDKIIRECMRAIGDHMER